MPQKSDRFGALFFDVWSNGEFVGHVKGAGPREARENAEAQGWIQFILLPAYPGIPPKLVYEHLMGSAPK